MLKMSLRDGIMRHVCILAYGSQDVKKKVKLFLGLTQWVTFSTIVERGDGWHE
jgi:hypothetical protein